jgi:isoaspartyl peptidase/L-asparaginase-like protein (Ntn-hydrolase superfamily)
VDTALARLAATGDPLEAAVAGAVLLEDDPRFNAGTGAIVRLDGSIQMDASVI